MRFFRALMGLLVLGCLAPVLSLLVAALVARWSGCDLDPDVPLRCEILGGDYGDIIFAVANFGWNAVIALPIMGAALVGWTVVEIFRASDQPKRPPQEKPSPRQMAARGAPFRRAPVRQVPAASRKRTRGS